MKIIDFGAAKKFLPGQKPKMNKVRGTVTISVFV
jgi:hypothetical protein